MTQSKRREEVAKVRRESIIDAAERVFFSKGYLNTTVDEIVKEAEYSKRTVYAYIKSKAEMYDEVALRAYERQHAFISAAKNDPDPAKALLEVMRAAIHFAEEFPGYTSVIVNYHIRLADSPESIPEVINEWDAKLLGVVEEVIERGIALGVFRDIDSRFAATYCASVFMGAVDLVLNKRHYLIKDRGMQPGEFIEQAMEMLLYSVMK